MEANGSAIIQLADIRPLSRRSVVAPHSLRDICRPGTECLDFPGPVGNLIRGVLFLASPSRIEGELRVQILERTCYLHCEASTNRGSSIQDSDQEQFL